MIQGEPVSKLYYSIREVSELTGVKPHVLRYWETEFPTLRPRKGRDGSRRYRQRDIEEVQAIRALLWDQGFKIAGARKALQDLRQAAKVESVPAQMTIGFEQLELREQVAFLRHELQEIQAMLHDLAPDGD
jgi:DNA-binding transcriptional MerR regulator